MGNVHHIRYGTGEDVTTNHFFFHETRRKESLVESKKSGKSKLSSIRQKEEVNPCFCVSWSPGAQLYTRVEISVLSLV